VVTIIDHITGIIKDRKLSDYIFGASTLILAFMCISLIVSTIWPPHPLSYYYDPGILLLLLLLNGWMLIFGTFSFLFFFKGADGIEAMLSNGKGRIVDKILDLAATFVTIFFPFLIVLILSGLEGISFPAVILELIWKVLLSIIAFASLFSFVAFFGLLYLIWKEINSFYILEVKKNFD
jgi:hypothetical protein